MTRRFLYILAIVAGLFSSTAFAGYTGKKMYSNSNFASQACFKFKNSNCYTQAYYGGSECSSAGIPYRGNEPGVSGASFQCFSSWDSPSNTTFVSYTYGSCISPEVADPTTGECKVPPEDCRPGEWRNPDTQQCENLCAPLAGRAFGTNVPYPIDSRASAVCNGGCQMTGRESISIKTIGPTGVAVFEHYIMGPLTVTGSICEPNAGGADLLTQSTVTPENPLDLDGAAVGGSDSSVGAITAGNCLDAGKGFIQINNQVTCTEPSPTKQVIVDTTGTVTTTTNGVTTTQETTTTQTFDGSGGSGLPGSTTVTTTGPGGTTSTTSTGGTGNGTGGFGPTDSANLKTVADAVAGRAGMGGSTAGLEGQKSLFDGHLAGLENAIRSIGEAPRSDPTWAWLPTFPEAQCAPWQIPRGNGQHLTIDPCPAAQMIRELGGYLLWFVTAFGLFTIVTRKKEA